MKNEIHFWLSLLVLFSFDSDFFPVYSSFYTAQPRNMNVTISCCIVVVAVHFVSLEPIRKEKARCEKSKLNFYLLLLFFIRFGHSTENEEDENKMIRKKFERNRVSFLVVAVVVGRICISHILLLASACSLFFTRPSQFFVVVVVVVHAF